MKFPSKKPRPAMSLTTTLVIAFFTLSAVSLLISSGLQIATNIQPQRVIISSQQHLIAQDAAQSVSNFIQEKFSVLETTIRLVDLVTVSPQEQKQFLDSVLGLEPAIRQLVVLNAQGKEVGLDSRTSLGSAKQLSDQMKSDIITHIKQGKHYSSAISIDPNTSEPLIHIALPATNAMGDVEGILVAEVNLKFMWDVVEQLKVGESGYAYVVDRQGNLIAFRDTARVIKGENMSQFRPVSDFVQHLESAQATEVNTSIGITGTTMVSTYISLGEPDWAVVIELPWEEAYRGIIWQALFSLGITLAMAVMAGLLGVVVARRLAVPLINLTGTATRITGGEVELQALVGGPREVTSLAIAFNSMTFQLRQTLQGLEQRVAERTNNLQHALAEVEARAHAQELLLTENQQQRETIREMSVPVLPVTESTLVMPLIGALDSDRLRLLQSQALQEIERTSARTLILDITGVLIVDSQVAQGLLIVVQAARLLGTEVLLVGVRPEVAQAIVGLGLNMPGLRTYNNLQSALSRMNA